MTPEAVLALPAVQQAHLAQERLAAIVQELARAAYYDDLTKLPNKQALQAAARLYDARGELEVAVVFLDLAGFKALNDGPHGHDAGDAGLAEVGDYLAMLRERDKVEAYRNGGDEFVCLVPQQTVQQSLPRLRQFFWPLRFHYNGTELELRANIGFARPEPGITLKGLITRADQACRIAKATGDGRPVEWCPDLEDDAPTSARRRCGSCNATTTVLVAPGRRTSEHLSRCANCYVALSDTAP